MTDDPDDWSEIYRAVQNVVGFHGLLENEHIELDHVKRLQYEAQVYAGGVALAQLILQKFNQGERS